MKELHIFADNDEPGALAARAAADRYAQDGLRVRIRFPADRFGDWNDALQAMAGPQ